MTFHVIGIGNKETKFSVTMQELFVKTKFFSGGKRHYDLVKRWLPDNHQWIYIASPMQEVFEQYNAIDSNIIVFASGNPLFYGFANTLQRQYPNATLKVTPYFSSIQLLANKTITNSSELKTVTVHGRSWNALDEAIIKQEPLIGVLTDRLKNPATIAKRLLTYGYDNYKIYIGEDLEGEKECIYRLSLAEAKHQEYHKLNCVLLVKTYTKQRHFGIPDTSFRGLKGRPNMITKMPIRLTSLHYLEIENIKTFWDIGFCTGAISIEAKLKNPELEIIAFEKREECCEILEENQQKFGTPGITHVMGNIYEKDLTKYQRPDAIFIGGHGGRLEELLERLDAIITTNTILVINAVQEQSKETFLRKSETLGYTIASNTAMQIDMHNTINIIKSVK